jgi:hypothetical protein
MKKPASPIRILCRGSSRLKRWHRFAPSMMFAPVPLLLNFFAVAMRVNHGKDENDQPARQQDNEDGFILPDFADKFGQIRIHAKTSYTMFVKNENNTGFGVPPIPQRRTKSRFGEI